MADPEPAERPHDHRADRKFLWAVDDVIVIDENGQRVWVTPPPDDKKESAS